MISLRLGVLTGDSDFYRGNQLVKFGQICFDDAIGSSPVSHQMRCGGRGACSSEEKI